MNKYFIGIDKYKNSTIVITGYGRVFILFTKESKEENYGF